MNKGIIIIGMYHSGTSFLAKRFIDAGIQMCGGGGYQDDIHYECKQIFELNKAEMNRNTVKVTDHIEYKPTEQMIRSLISYRHQRMASGQPWGFKDPQCAILAGAYLRTFQQSKIIMCVRNPVRVSQTSLRRGLVPDPARRIMAYCNTVGRFYWIVKNHSPMPEVFTFNYDADKKEREQMEKSLQLFTETPVSICKEWRKM